MQNVLCCVPCSPIRADASHKAEMVSQLLFGERGVVLEQSVEHWIKIRCSYDDYEGWCQNSHFIESSPVDERHASAMVSSWEGTIHCNGTIMHVPMGSSLDGIKKGRLSWGKLDMVYHGKILYPEKKKWERKDIVKLASVFLNTPYLWGGKSVFGTDCSGFTQTIFRFLNIPLLRDAWQQATMGEQVESLKVARTGDLAFFDNAAGKITHVGILLSKKKIIHASGKVRVDKFTEEGIINDETGDISHRLKLIRRFF